MMDFLTSCLVEIAVCSAAYLLLANGFSQVLRAWMSKAKFWNGDVKERSGLFCCNAQDDVILDTVIGLHHGTAAMLCGLGILFHNAKLWQHGYLLEVGYEIGDLIAMAVPLYPYKVDNVKPEVKFGLFLHHLPGLIVPCFLLNAGLHDNLHVQVIAFALLVSAAGVTLTAPPIYAMNLAKYLPQVTILYWINLVFFVYCRCYVFPQHAILLLDELKKGNDDGNTDPTVTALLYFDGFLLNLFNVSILADAIPKGVRYILRSQNGKTRIDTKEVPLSLEDRWKNETLKQQ